MQTIVDIVPLKTGHMEAYQAFLAKLAGPRHAAFVDMLERYGLKTADVYFHTVAGVPFAIVTHLAEDDARIRLEKFASSTHPMEQWFCEQLAALHDFAPLNGAPQAATLLFHLKK